MVEQQLAFLNLVARSTIDNETCQMVGSITQRGNQIAERQDHQLYRT